MILKPKLLSTGKWWDGSWWSPFRGCTHCGPACDRCWAKRLIEGRLKRFNYCPKGFWAGPVPQSGPDYYRPLHWQQPRVVGVCGFSDLFHEQIPDSGIEWIYRIMQEADQHLYIIPTKRASRAAEWYASENHWRFRRLPNVWLLASVWDQESADRMIPELLRCPAAKVGLSYEPALGPLDLAIRGHVLGGPWLRRLGLVIDGGESGADARPTHPDSFRKVRDQCAEAGVPYLHKQHGEWMHETQLGIQVVQEADGYLTSFGFSGLSQPIPKGTAGHKWPDGSWSLRVGKRRAGRLLDGVEHNGWPTAKDGSDDNQS